ncbi:putative meiotically up-regulated gene protein [Cadophora sp. MPI-SDFR-AT-0126]|nr:putative meiotically up-regulated gene protein [Leotiomycetes sp. MPI-SDFR-AT-0126]
MNGTSAAGMKHDESANAIPNAPKPATTSNLTTTTLPEEDLTTRALRFLSTASPETIGVIAIGLAASTYLILGRFGLLLIGTVGGVVLHAAWEGQCHAVGSMEEIRREKGLDVIKRLLDVREILKSGLDDEITQDDRLVGNSFEDFRPETAAALNELVDSVMRDYVKWWYQPILPNEESFPRASRTTLTKFILAISQHLSRKRHADTFLDFLTNSSSIVIVFLNELSTAISASQGNVPPVEAVHAYLVAHPASNLANILNEKQQSKKFKMVAEDVLQSFLEKQTYDCDPARLFLREILGGLILQKTLTSCSKPEWINGWIVYLLEEGEPDFSQAIDAGMGGRGSDEAHSGPFHDIDGNVGNVGLVKPSKVEKQTLEMKGHKKRLSKAEEAMEEAMEEAKRLSQLIADEDAKRIRDQRDLMEDVPEAVVAAVEQTAQSLRLDTSPLTTRANGSSSDAERSLTNGALKPSQTAASPESKALQPTTPVFQDSVAQSQPQDSLSSPQSSTSPTSKHTPAFTSFDQIVPRAVHLALQDESPMRRRKTVSLTLHNANIIIHDDSTSSDKGRLRSKPSADYLVQIEPVSSDHPGWMIVRRYPDFETLHEVLRRIAQVSGVKAFTEQHQSLPNWKEHTKSSLRGEMERYLRDALWYKELAESEGMKRFLEKDQGQATSTSKNGFPGIGWPTPSAFETMGKGMLDVLTSAPKGVAEGGKAIGGGITGVFTNIGNLGQKKVANGTHVAGRSSTSTLPRMDSMNSIVASSRSGRASEDSLRTTPIISTQPSMLPTMPRQNSIAESENEREAPVSARSSMSGRRSLPQSRDHSRAPSSRRGTPLSSPIHGVMDDMKLPPPPGEIADDYGSYPDDSSMNSRTESNVRTSTSTVPSQPSPGRPSLSGTRRSSIQVASTPAKKHRPQKEQTPLTEAETKVAVELMFAVTNELYTLSSAWNIRRTLLNAAKTFLLRPANPSLAAIQCLIQDSVIASNTSDAGVAAHIKNIRASSLPTEDELRQWPAEMSTEEKDKLRLKARKLLVERGVPTALTGVMGQAATGEAMGRIFDCLQVEEVAKGLVFGLLLQGVRAVTQ